MTRSILIVEDNPLEVLEITSFLQAEDFSLTVVGDAEQAWVRLQTDPFDVVLCDLHLPGENGFEFCRRIKSSPVLRDLQVVLLTRFSDPLNFLRGLEAGADGFISKGQCPEIIVKRLTRILKRSHTPSLSAGAAPERVVFLETEFELNAERGQLLEVLLSGFEDVVHLNEKYEEEVAARVKAQSSLAEANQRLQALNRSLEQRVAARTTELKAHVHMLEKKNTELDQFVYVASHDLQEPVRKLISFSQLLEQDVGAELNEQAASDLHYIKDAAQRMQVLIYDLLALSRAGRAAMQREWVDLNECVDQALESLSLRVEETRAEIVRAPLPLVYGNRSTLTQLYHNLLGNALKFTRCDRPVIELTAEGNGESLTFGVRDNGIGVEPEYCEQIFAPFCRLHGRDEYEGSGIGLAICRTIVERHEGRIWLESPPHGGSHFRFTLPAPQHANDTVTCLALETP